MQIFRTFEHNNRVLELAAIEFETVNKAQKPAHPPFLAPGAGEFEVGLLSLSTDKISAGEQLTLTAQIIGSNIAFIYTDLLFCDPDGQKCYGSVAQEFVLSPSNEESQDTSHPVWGHEVKLNIPFKPNLRILTDGTNSAFAFLTPAAYGHSGYHLEGIYLKAGTTSWHRARLGFDNTGLLTSSLIYKERVGRSSSPRSIRISEGDQFCPFVQSLVPPGADTSTWQVENCVSTRLTKSDQDLRWLDEAPLPGNYLLGLVIEDLDGVRTRHYSPFTLGE